MEILLFKRHKSLGFSILIAASFCFLTVAVFYPGSGFSNKEIYESVADNIEDQEDIFKKEIRLLEDRAQTVFEKFNRKKLKHRELLPKEALIIEEGGDITSYYGEIYHFELRDLRPGEWTLIEMNRDIFFLKKLAVHIFYIKFFLNLDDNFLVQNFAYRFALAELKFIKEKAKVNQADLRYRYDEARRMFLYSHILKPSQDRLMLRLRFSKEDIREYFQKNKKILLYLSTLVLLLVALSYFFYKKNRLVTQLSWFVVLVHLFFFLSFLGSQNFYLKLWNIQLNSTYQVLIIGIFLVSLLYVFRDRFRFKMVNWFAFNLAVILSMALGQGIFKGVDFIYSNFRFGINYLTLIFLIFLLHLLPLFFLKGIVVKKNVFNIAGLALVQFLAVILGYYVFRVLPMNILIFSIILFISIFFKAGFLSRLVVVFFLAISIFYLVSHNTHLEKKEFITNNLKNIFLNQKNYAKFIAREMVHEINSSSPSLSEFFQESSTSTLVDIWRTSIARQENIASGIFLISKGGDVRSQYYYQMPFIKIPTQEFFPFWAIEDTTAELYGKEISLAIASSSVNKRRELLGYIIVQVLNSPKLILRHQEKVNIFTIDNKIDGRDFSYIKFNQDNQIVENPSNINLENVAGFLENDNRWVKFKFTGLVFYGYIFKHDRDSIIIFFPENTFFKNFSEIIKIFLFLCFFVFLFYFKELGRVEWKSIYYSFSIRVFSFLILISLLTAIIFSIFSLNFNIQSSERELRQIRYESGRTAQNIGYNFINNNSEITQDHLVLISEILNSDVSVYENGIFLDSSNQRKYIDAEIPIYLHSNILQSFNKQKQKFVLSNDGFDLFFKINEYIFDVEFSYDWRKILAERSYHTDFIITLFFILAVIGFSSAFFFRNKILSPIHELNRGMAEVEKGNLGQLEKIPSETEIKSLYLGFNSMVEGIRREKQNISEISRMKTIIKLG